MKKDIKPVFAKPLFACLAIMAATSPADAQAVNAPPAPAIAATVKTLQQVCMPVLAGGDVKTSARAEGFRLKDGQWVLRIKDDRRIELTPPDAANPHVCSAAVYANPQSQAALRQALTAWAGAQKPPLTPVNGPSAVATAGWSISVWRGQTSARTLSVALAQAQPAPGQPASVAQSNLEVSLTPT